MSLLTIFDLDLVLENESFNYTRQISTVCLKGSFFATGQVAERTSDAHQQDWIHHVQALLHTVSLTHKSQHFEQPAQVGSLCKL